MQKKKTKKNLKASAKASKACKIPVLDWIYTFLIEIMPAVLFFSYFPLMKIGGNETMNFELSIPLIWLVVFDAVGLMVWIRNGVREKKWFEGFSWKNLLWWLLPIFITLSIIWSLNPLRGILTVGVMWLIYFAIMWFVILKKKVQYLAHFKRNFWRWFFGSSLVVSLWCWIQCVLDEAGVPRQYSLMCDGCAAYTFGFPRPDGFAIEPQFMGNLLIAPTLIAAWKVLKNRKMWWVFLPLVATLFLTMSRGAIYAFLVGLIVLTILVIVQTRKWWYLMIWMVTIAGFLFTLNAQGIMAAVGPTNDTYAEGVAKVLHQMTLGKLDLRDEVSGTDKGNDDESNSGKEGSTVLENDEVLMSADAGGGAEGIAFSGETVPGDSFENNEQESVPWDGLENDSEDDAQGTSSDDEQEALFDGYVEESTNTRLRLTDSAIKIWQENLQTIWFGVGIGGAGRALYNHGFSPAPKEIVQNEYASLLLEAGLVGILLAFLTIGLVLKMVAKSPLWVVLVPLLIAYGITLCFFSGLPNALQIYLIPALLITGVQKYKIAQSV